MDYRKLGQTDMHVSILGYGASPLGNVFDVCDEKEGIESVHLAIDHGVNFFDVAPFYGETLAETRLGRALKGKRKDIYLATKCGRYGLRDFDFSYDRIIRSIDESLERLQTDYVDLFQLHDIEFVSRQQIIDEAIPAIHHIKASGKARYIGLTGLPVRYLASLARENDFDTVLSWAHYNLIQDELMEELVPLSKEKGFGLMNAAPLVQRILSDAPIPAWHNAPAEIQAIQAPLIALCQKYQVPLSDVAMRFAMDQEAISTTIVGMCDLNMIQSNLRAFHLQMPNGILDEIAALVAPIKNKMWFEGLPENDLRK
jgi:L-galactose dehydrogenase